MCPDQEMNDAGVQDRVDRVRSGDVRFVSRLIRKLEDGSSRAKTVVKSLYQHTGKARIIGMTGAPGAGKSTLSDALITCYRQQGKEIGVLAVDPTSPFTGGAILGDRVRMQKHAEDPHVYVRSFATRGALGGLADAVDDAVHVLDAMGKDIILVETVGIGQSEVDIMNNAHSVVLVLTPGMGDEVQTIKAGVMEVADLFVINKADRPGTAKLYQELNRALDMAPDFPSGWRPPILKVENVVHPKEFLVQVDEVRTKLEEHFQILVDKEILAARERRKASVQFKHSLERSILKPVLVDLESSGRLDSLLDKLLDKQTDPASLAEDVADWYRTKQA